LVIATQNCEGRTKTVELTNTQKCIVTCA